MALAVQLMPFCTEVAALLHIIQMRILAAGSAWQAAWSRAMCSTDYSSRLQRFRLSGRHGRPVMRPKQQRRLQYATEQHRALRVLLGSMSGALNTQQAWLPSQQCPTATFQPCLMATESSSRRLSGAVSLDRDGKVSWVQDPCAHA